MQRSLLVLWAVAAPAASAATLVVDNDRAQCPTAACRTIQSAVDAAAPGDTVRVCAGGYREPVFIRPDKAGLILEAARSRTVTITVGLDCYDHADIDGPPPPEDQNVWTFNRGRTSNPPGICTP